MKMIIPKKQKDIKVKDFLVYKDYILKIDKENIDEKEMLYKTIDIFYHIEKSDIDKLPYTTVKQMFTIIQNILNMKQELVRTFTLDNVEYGLVPNFDDMTFAEWVDIDTEDVIQQIAVLYRPIIKKFNNKYKIKDYEADVSHMDRLKEELTLDVYNSFINFFLTLNKHLLNATLNFTEKAVGTEMNLKKDLDLNGVGFLGSMN